LNPVYTIIINYDPIPETNYLAFQDIRIIYLQRTGINSFKVEKFNRSRINDLPYKEAIKLVSKYDISKDFPNKKDYNIIYYPPLTKAEIEANREAWEKYRNPDPVNETTEENVKRRVDNEIPQDARETFRNLFIVDENGNFRDGPDDWEAMKKWLDDNYPENN
jgi:hypothetical protein